MSTDTKTLSEQRPHPPFQTHRGHKAMTSEITVPEAAIDAACAAFFDECEKAADLDWLSLQQGRVEIRGAFSKDAVFRAILAAALPHLSTAIRDAALEKAFRVVRRHWNDGGSSWRLCRQIEDEILALKGKSIPAPAEGNEAEAADSPSDKLGKWLSAALGDPNVCAEMKADINAWFKAGQPAAPAQAPGELVERLALAEMILAHAEDPALAPVATALSAAIAALSQEQRGAVEKDILRDVLFWANHKCPADGEAVPCKLCGARADVNGPDGVCKALEYTLPSELLARIRRALAATPVHQEAGE